MIIVPGPKKRPLGKSTKKKPNEDIALACRVLADHYHSVCEAAVYSAAFFETYAEWCDRGRDMSDGHLVFDLAELAWQREAAQREADKAGPSALASKFNFTKSFFATLRGRFAERWKTEFESIE